MPKYICIAVMLLFVPGCGSEPFPRAAVKGKVTFDGQPISKGTILFVPTGGNSEGAASAEILEGNYQLPRRQGPAVGTHQVQVLAMRNNGKIEAGPPHPPGTLVEDIQQYIPARYNHQSELKEELKPGENTLDFTWLKE